MEPKELSPAMLQAQVTVVATLGELQDTLATQEEEMLLLESSKRLHKDLEEFTKELWVALHCIDDTWRRHIVTGDDDDPVTSLSRALAAYGSTPQTTQDRVAMAATKWQWSVNVLVDRWAQLARKATEIRDTWSKVATEAMNTEFRELQEKGAHYGKALLRMMGLGQALGGEEGAKVAAAAEFSEAMAATSEAIKAALERQWLWAALGPLQRLVAACDEATALPRELQRLLGDIKTALEGTKKKFPDVPKTLVAKVAEAERLWEANARLAKDHLLGIIYDILDFYSNGGRARPSAHGVLNRCQRAIEDISRLLQPPELPQRIPKLSQLSPALLQAQVTVVATLGELLDTLPMWEEMLLLESPKQVHRDLEEFTKELWVTLRCIDDTWRRHIVTNDDDDPVTSLSWALAAYGSTPGTSQDAVARAAREWQGSVSVLVNSWAELVRKATKLCNVCRDLATKAADRAGTATTRARDLQAQAARDGTALENMVELGQALGREEGAKVVAGPESPVMRKARVAASEATTATMVRQRVEAALGLLERLVAACDEATAFPRELKRLLRDTKTALEGTKKKFPDVPEDLVAKVAMAERLWEASARLAKDHLLGIIEDFLDYCSKGGRANPSAHEVAERCQRAIEDIPNLQG